MYSWNIFLFKAVIWGDGGQEQKWCNWVLNSYEVSTFCRTKDWYRKKAQEQKQGNSVLNSYLVSTFLRAYNRCELQSAHRGGTTKFINYTVFKSSLVDRGLFDERDQLFTDKYWTSIYQIWLMTYYMYLPTLFNWLTVDFNLISFFTFQWEWGFIKVVISGWNLILYFNIY